MLIFSFRQVKLKDDNMLYNEHEVDRAGFLTGQTFLLELRLPHFYFSSLTPAAPNS
jgi:hypothetical protein